MRFKFSRRTKLIVSTIGISLIVLSGAIFGLAKTGVINIKPLADEIVANTKGLIGEKSLGATVIFDLTATCWPSGTHVIIVGDNGMRYSSAQLTQPIGGGVTIATITGVAPGNYTGDASANVTIDPFSISAGQETSRTGGGVNSCGSVSTGTICGTQTCSATQTCVTHGGFEGQPVTYSCEDKPTSTQAYLLNGIIKDSSGNPLAGASIEVLDKTNPAAPRPLARVTSSATYSDGVAPNQRNYQTDIIITSNSATPYANIFLEVTSGGVKMDPVNLGQAGSIIATKIDSNRVETDQVKPLAFAPTQTGKIDIQGLIKDDAGNLLAGRYITTGCITTPQTSYDACKLKLNAPNYPYATSTLNPVLNHGTNENYIINNVYDFRNETAFANITLNVAAPSNQYYYDKNKNGSEDTDEPAGSAAHVQIGQAAIQNSQTAGQNAYVIVEDIVFKLIPAKKFSVIGQVYYKDDSGNKVYVPGADASLKSVAGTELGKSVSATSLFWPSDGNKIANMAIDDLSYQQDTEAYQLDIKLQDGYLTADGHNSINSTFFNSQIITVGTRNYYSVDFQIYKANDFEIKVFDALSKEPISGASISISDKGCPIFGTLTGETDINGFISFSGPKTLSYLASRGNFSACTPVPYATITKNGYLTTIRTVGSSVVGNILNIYMSKITTQLAGNISVKVHLNALSDDRYINQAKVIVRKITAPDIDFATQDTDSNGLANFNLPVGNYFFTAYKAGFTSSKASIVYYNVTSTSAAQIHIALTPTFNTVYKRIFVLDLMTHEALVPSSIKVTDTSSGQSVTLQSNTLGVSFFDFQDKAHYTIEAKYLQQTTTIDIDVVNDDSRDYFLFFDTHTTQIIDSVNLHFLDSSTGEPITSESRLTAKYFPANYHSCHYISNTYSSYKLLEDFKIVEPDSNRTCLITQGFVNGQTINIQAWADGYQTQLFTTTLVSAADTASVDVFLSLVPSKPTTMHKIKASGDVSYRAIELQEMKNGIWVTIKTKPDWLEEEDENTSQAASYAVFMPTEEGQYRAVVDAGGSLVIASEAANFDNTADIYLYVDFANRICEPEANKLLKDYGEGFYFLFENKAQYDDNPSFYDSLAEKLRVTRSNSKIVSPLIVSFGNLGTINAFSHGGTISDCLGVKNAHLLEIGNEQSNIDANFNRENEIYNIITHEYGHQVYGLLEDSNSPFFSKWENLYNMIMELPADERSIIFDVFLDSVNDNDPTFFMGHPWDNANEMFASFFSAYYSNHDQLYGAISFRVSNNAQAQNILAYMWQIFSDNIGSVYSNDSGAFRPVARDTLSAGFTLNQIQSGSWRTLNYSSMNLTQKAMVQYSISVAPTINTTMANIRRSVIVFNNMIDRLRLSMGLSSNVGSAKITFLNRNNKPIKNYIVQIGPKLGITDTNGVAIIAGIPSGNQKISKVQSASSGTLLKVTIPSPNLVEIHANQTLTTTAKVAN